MIVNAVGSTLNILVPNGNGVVVFGPMLPPPSRLDLVTNIQFVAKLANALVLCAALGVPYQNATALAVTVTTGEPAVTLPSCTAFLRNPVPE